MNTYEVTYKFVASSLRAEEPLVHGRDRDYQSVAVKETLSVQGDRYSVSANGTAHFYESASAKDPVASVLGVISVRKVPEEGSGGRSNVPWGYRLDRGGGDGRVVAVSVAPR